ASAGGESADPRAETRPGGRGKTTRPEPWSGTLARRNAGTRRNADDQAASGCGFLPRLAQSAALLDADEAQAEEDDRQEDEQAPAGDAGIDPELRREEPDERIIGVELPSAVAEEELVEVAEEAVPAEHGHNGDSTHEDDAEDRAQSHSGVDAHAASAAHVEAEEDRADEADERDQIEQRDEPLDIGHVAELIGDEDRLPIGHDDIGEVAAGIEVVQIVDDVGGVVLSVGGVETELIGREARAEVLELEEETRGDETHGQRQEDERGGEHDPDGADDVEDRTALLRHLGL